MRILRRSVITSLMMLGIAPAVAAIPSTDGPTAACGPSTPPPGVSPTMSRLISDFLRLSAALDAADHDTDPAAWERAADARGPALDALVFHRPANVAELAAKMTALVQFISEEDGELFAFRILAEDATLLAGEEQ